MISEYKGMIPLQLEPAFAGNNPALAGTADFSRKTKPPPLGGGAFTLHEYYSKVWCSFYGVFLNLSFGVRGFRGKSLRY